jgi:hypothetical protein
MRDRLWMKGFILGIILLFLGASVLPSINALPIPKNINKNSGQTLYYFLREDVSGKGDITTLGGYSCQWSLTNGTATIKSLFSIGGNFSIHIFDKLTTTEPLVVLDFFFIGTRSYNPFEIHGYAIWALVSQAK